MEFQEYPKSLYRNREELVVQDRNEDEAAAKEGWTDWNTDYNNSVEVDEPVAEGEVKTKRKYTRRATAE